MAGLSVLVAALLAATTARASVPTPITDCSDDSQLQSDAAAGGSYVFNCPKTDSTIMLTKTVTINSNFSLTVTPGQYVEIDGPCTDSAASCYNNGKFFRSFDIEGGSVQLAGLQLLYGAAVGSAGAAGNPDGGDGGAAVPGGGTMYIAPGANVTLIDDQVAGEADGGRGGAGNSPYSNGGVGTPGNGGAGGDAEGGSIYVSSGATLTMGGGTLITGGATAGTGGAAGSAADNSSNNGGNGGNGGNAYGGGLYNAGTVMLTGHTTWESNAASSKGGTDGFGACNPNCASGGNGGTAEGGAIYNGGTLDISCTPTYGTAEGYQNKVSSTGGAAPYQGTRGQGGTTGGADLFNAPSGSVNVVDGGASCDPLVVDDVGDAPAVNPSAGCVTAADTCTLRAAIQAVNAGFGGSSPTIMFDIAGQSGMPVISPSSPLPAVSVPVVIDGASQPGASSGEPGVRLDGAGAGKGANGLELDGQGSVVKGLDVTGFTHDGILLKGNGSQVTGSWVGVVSAGSSGFADAGNLTGIEVASSGDTIGGTSAAARDVISGNGRESSTFKFLQGYRGSDSAYTEESDLSQFGAGVLLQTNDVSGLTVDGDYVGVGPDGKDLAPGISQPVGIMVVSPGSVSGVTIGGSGAAGNDISGNLIGVAAGGKGLTSLSTVKVEGNLIGPVADGTASKNELGNGIGILTGPVVGLQIGAPGAGNMIQGDFIGLVAGGSDSAPLKGALIQDNAFGADGSILSSSQKDVGLSDGIGAVLGGTSGVSFSGNKVLGDLLGVFWLEGDKDSITGNVFGRAKDIGVPYTDLDSSAGAIVGLGSILGSDQSVSSNKFFDDQLGILTAGDLGTSIRSNLFSTNEDGLLDVVDAKDVIGGSGSGNVFVRSGVGLLLDSEYLAPTQDSSAGLPKGALGQSSFDRPLSDPQGQAEYNAATGVEPKPIDPKILDLTSNLGKGDVIQGNLFGTDAQDASGDGNQIGAEILDNVTGAQFGGSGKGDGNTVRNNDNAGLLIFGTPSHPPTVEVLGDTFYGDGIHPGSDKPVSGLGLDLVTGDSFTDTITGYGFGPDRLDPSQPGDGANHLQNYPVLTGAQTNGSKATVTGTLDSTPKSAYTIQLFASPKCSPTGYGEAEQLIDTLKITTNPAGHASFNTTSQTPIRTAPPRDTTAKGQYITATATNNTTHTTSELSRCTQAK